MAVQLPDDILALLCDTLYDARDTSTLFNFALACSRFACHAFPSLYQLHESGPFRDEEDIDIISPGEQELRTQKWSIMWRSLILSTFGETQFEYCRHLRQLELRDFQNLLVDELFRGRIRTVFFSGKLKQFLMEEEYKTFKGKTMKRLNILAIMEAVGNALVSHAPLLEEIAGNFPPEALASWVEKLPRLKSLDFGDGMSIGTKEVQEAIINRCPNFQNLSIFKWGSPPDDYIDRDQILGTFISNLRPNSLRKLDLLTDDVHASTATCLALNNHGESLAQLHLCFNRDRFPALAHLKDCVNIRDLKIEAYMPGDFEVMQPTAFKELVDWLSSCKKLHTLVFEEVQSAPKILTPVLLQDGIKLRELEVVAKHNLYSMSQNRIFHQALETQTELTSLSLRCEGDEVARTDVEALVNSIRHLAKLKSLRLPGFAGPAEEFEQEDTMRMLAPLTELEDLSIGGQNYTDAFLQFMAAYKNLKKLTVSAISSFTTNGLLNFVSGLGPGNTGLEITIDFAQAYSLISEDSIARVRHSLYEKVGGRFDVSGMIPGFFFNMNPFANPRVRCAQYNNELNASDSENSDSD